MIKIDNSRCCCCGHCQFIRMVLPLFKSENGVDYYEDPSRPEDQKFIDSESDLRAEARAQFNAIEYYFTQVEY